VFELQKVFCAYIDERYLYDNGGGGGGGGSTNFMTMKI